MTFLLVLKLLAWASLEVAAAPASNESVTVTVGHVGANAYAVTNVVGADDLAELDEQNATWKLTINTRYEFVNPAGAAHPLALRAGDDVLLAQMGGGSFADDSSVAVETDSERLAFTLTQELAEKLDNYVCLYHPEMTGTVIVGSNTASKTGHFER